MYALVSGATDLAKALINAVSEALSGHAGTTSKPKGVPLTHANLAASLHNIAATYELTDRDRSLLVMPLFHVHGLMAGMKHPSYPPQCLSYCLQHICLTLSNVTATLQGQH